MKFNVFLLCILVSSVSHVGLRSQTTIFDYAITNGRVIDPETGLDTIKNIGVLGDRIATITSKKIEGEKVIDASGLVVSPGFIDPHVHGVTHEAHKYQIHDGVTTALELEGGIGFIDAWLASKEGKSIVNYGASVPHGTIRALAMESFQVYLPRVQKVIAEEGYDSPNLDKLMINMGRSAYQALSQKEMSRVDGLIDEELSKGALGIGVPVGYYPGATHGEIFNVYSHAADRGVPIFSHTRGFKMPGIQEAISNATTTGASLHIVHANSLSLAEIDVTLAMVASAQANGLDITTEVYPYTAASTSLESAIFDDGWQELLGISYGDIQWEATGERLTKETFDAYREQGGIVIIHMMKPEWIKRGLAHPVTMIGSDGMPYAPGAHPRTAGTYSRILGKYVREEKVLDLPTAIKKMTLMPAQRLEGIAPMMRRKGRLQIGTDADITIFDPKKIIDKADFKGLAYSAGITHVFVNGVLMLSDGELSEGIFPGRAVVSKYRN